MSKVQMIIRECQDFHDHGAFYWLEMAGVILLGVGLFFAYCI